MSICKILKPKTIICGENALKNVQQMRTDVDSIQTLISYGPSGADLTFDQLINESSTNPQNIDWSIPVDLDSNASLLCSSGTTGPPKCVELTYKNFQRCLSSFKLFYPNGPKIISEFLPQYHGYGLMVCLEAILSKKNVVVFSRFEICNFLEACEKFKVGNKKIVIEIT